MWRRDDGSMPEHRDSPLVTMGESNPAWDEIDGECIETTDAVRREAARLEALIQEDYETWSRQLALTAPIPSVFLPGGEK
jgi:hypothetical protein